MVVMDLDEEATREGENIEEVVNAEESIDDEAVDIHEEEVGDVKDDLVGEILTTIEFLDQISDYRRTQQKECFNLVRRLKILIPFMDEIRGFEFPSPENCMHFLNRLRKVILTARKLLETCNNGSKIFLALDSELIMTRFHSIYEKLNRVLVKTPFDELGISDEVKDEVGSLCKQLKKARRRTDTQDIELAVDMMVMFSKTDPRNADSAIIERLAKKLELQTMEDLKTETIAIKTLVQEKGGLSIETKQHIIELLNKFKKLQGVEATDVLYEPVINKSTSLVLPHEFLCPITLEIMQDPVIIATGQTYEKEGIQKWFDAGHKTCPKTGQTLDHLSLAPNYALKNIILQWCEKNNFKIPEKETSLHSENDSEEQKDEVSLLVEALSSSQLEEQRASVKQMRLLAKENPENRVLIANAGAIPLLVQLLSYPDSGIQENAVTTLLNLSIDETNKKLISDEGAIPDIIEILQNGNREARENSAAALFSLSMLDENKVTIGLSNGIPPLVELLQHGTSRGKKDALTALFNLSLNSANKGRAIDAGIVQPLLQLLKDRNLGMIDEALSILLLLVSHPEGRQAIGQLSFIETLVDFIRQGTPKNKECAASVLLELGSNNSSFILAALQFGVYEYLVDITSSGTNRAQRKANALIQLISKSEQI
ncbi:PREDICTED: U-box domain-containing protein 15 [Brassica oleracea var. oleracea]|uniref:RING-type E3 ubiquitin transferase n=1 Tax=Brassica oleracea var. oleracea TaxID=109376 RepID=A0A0D3E5Z6_BRAOL|nr:PREDICTED: U-box domain-containing protein 15 [Brassica oleracea var. oleracea]